MPRIHRSLRRLRFSLRSAAIVLTVVCVWLGLTASRARRQLVAVAELARLGVSVDYDRGVEDLWAPDWLRNFVGDDYFLNVVEVRLYERSEGRQSRGLTPAEFDAVVAAMQRLPRLQSIYFAYTGVRDDDLRRFAPLAGQIEDLYFNEGWRSVVTGAGLGHLAAWPKLASLGMPYGSKDPKALDQLAKFPALTTLSWGNQELNEDAFAAIARCRRLEHVTVFMCRFYGAAFRQLRNAPALKSAFLHNTRPMYYARPWPDGARPSAPIDFDAGNEFEFVPDSGHNPLDPNAPKFPEKQYREWLEQMLPGVAVTEMSTS